MPRISTLATSSYSITVHPLAFITFVRASTLNYIFKKCIATFDNWLDTFSNCSNYFPVYCPAAISLDPTSLAIPATVFSDLDPNIALFIIFHSLTCMYRVSFGPS